MRNSEGDGRNLDEWRLLLIKHARSGDELDLAGPRVRSPRVDDGTRWPASRHLPAAALRGALLELQRQPQLADPRGLRIIGAEITDPLDLSSLSVPCQLWLDHSRLKAGADLDFVELPFLSLEGSTITGEVRAVGATIGGLNLDGATLANQGAIALNLEAATIASHVTLEEGSAAGMVNVSWATIGSVLLMRGATLTNEGETALALNGSRITGSVFLDEGTINGMVTAMGVTIGGDVVMSGATLTNEGETALALNGSRITGSVFLDEGTINGMVTAMGVTIGGDVVMSGATLTNEGESPPHARAKGKFSALALDGSRITGNVFLNDGFSATGEVRAYYATIGGQLDLSAGTLSNGDRDVLVLQGASVCTLFLRGLKVQEDGVLDLNTSTIKTLTLGRKGEQQGDREEEEALVPPGRLVAHGWHIANLYGAMASDAGLAQEWLQRRPKDRRYSPQPARALAEVYERSGHPAQARKLRYSAARKVAQSAPWPTRAWLEAYRWLVGHGYYPLRTAWWLLGFFLAAGLIASFNPALFEPTDPVQANDAAIGVRDTDPGADPEQEGQPLGFTVTGATPCVRLGTYPCFEAWPYALQTVIPPASAIQANAWQPTGWVLVAMTLFKAAGWVLVVLFLASISGLLRRT